MIGNWEIAALSEPHRYILYAEAYLQASKAVCLHMREEETEKTWPNAAVAMMLAAHSVELFLKGAILNRDPKAKLGIHRIDELAERYNDIYPEQEFKFDVPFQVEYLGFSETEIEALKKKNEPTPSVLFRYPVRRPGVEWQGIHAFEPQSFIELLAELKDAFERIGKSI